MKKLAACITDTHIKEGNEELVKDIFKQLIKAMKANGVKTLLHAGDWFNSRKGQPLSVIEASFDIKEMLLDAGITTHIIAGNHDKVDLNSESSFLTMLHDGDKFNVIREKGLIEYKNVSFYMVPYFKEKDKYPEILKKSLPKNNNNHCMLITHIAVNGVKNNDGSKVENDLGINQFKKFDSVLVGHYHDQSTLGDNVHYIGSAYQANYGEDEDKGFTWIMDNGDIEFQRLEFPTYEVFTLNVEEVTEAEINDLENLKKQNPKNNYRVKLTGDADQIKIFNKNKFYDIGIDVVSSADALMKNIDAAENDEVNFYNADKITKEFKSFCQQNEIENINYGLEKIEKCLM